MTILEDVRGMQQQGFSDEQIIQSLRDKNVPYRDIADALTQSKIKIAVESPETQQENPEYPTQLGEGMEPSLMNQEMPQNEAPQPTDYYPPAPAPQEYPQQYPQYQDYPQQYPPEYAQPAASADMISEISEQIVAEKFSEIRKQLEKVIDLKTGFESKVSYIDERLKRIEKVIDTLQSSVLRKVGDYVTNVQDLKTELVETQKTFAKLLQPQVQKQNPNPKRKKHHPQHQSQNQNHNNQQNQQHPQHNPHHDNQHHEHHDRR